MPMVRFLNTQSWAGEAFCYRPGEVIELDEMIALAREKAGLGSVVVDKSKKAKAEKPAETKDEPTA